MNKLFKITITICEIMEEIIETQLVIMKCYFIILTVRKFYYNKIIKN